MLSGSAAPVLWSTRSTQNWAPVLVYSRVRMSVNRQETSCCNSFPQWRSLNVFFTIFSWYYKVQWRLEWTTGHENNSSIEIYFQHLLPSLCSFMKATAPSRFTFSIYYPRWVRRCNSLIGHEDNSSIEIHFQQPITPVVVVLLPRLFVVGVLSLVVCLEPLGIAYSLWDITPPVRVVW